MPRYQRAVVKPAMAVKRNQERLKKSLSEPDPVIQKLEEILNIVRMLQGNMSIIHSVDSKIREMTDQYRYDSLYSITKKLADQSNTFDMYRSQVDAMRFQLDNIQTNLLATGASIMSLDQARIHIDPAVNNIIAFNNRVNTEFYKIDTAILALNESVTNMYKTVAQFDAIAKDEKVQRTMQDMLEISNRFDLE